MSPVEGLCLAGGGGLAQSVLVPASSARPVGFSVVPTAAAAMSLKVVAQGSSDFPVGDAVSKVLQIQVTGAAPNPAPQTPRFTPHPQPHTLSAGQTPETMPWSVYIFYNSDPTLPLMLKLQVLENMHWEGQVIVLCGLS